MQPEGQSTPLGAAPTLVGETAPPGFGIPVPASEPDLDYTIKELLGMMKDMMKTYETKIADFQKQLDLSRESKGKDTEEEVQLKPIHVKDLKLPEEYDGGATNFMEWHSRFKTMLENRNSSWLGLLKHVENHGDKRIKSTEQVKEEMQEKGYDSSE